MIKNPFVRIAVAALATYLVIATLGDETRSMVGDLLLVSIGIYVYFLDTLVERLQRKLYQLELKTNQVLNMIDILSSSNEILSSGLEGLLEKRKEGTQRWNEP